LVWKALADPTRRHILDLLRERPRTTGELSDAFSVTRFAVMKHLGVLEQAGLVVVRRRGRERWNHLNPVPIQQIAERWIRPYEAGFASSLVALKRHAEQKGGPAVAGEITSVHVEQEVDIGAPPERVWAALTEELEAWWGAPYLHGDATRLVLDPRPGGVFREDWGEGQGAVWGVVSAVERYRRLEVRGAMGMRGAVVGVTRFEFDAMEDGSTRVRLSHEAFGHIDAETERSYGLGWQDLLEVRLKAYIEEGVRYGLGQRPPPGAPTFEQEAVR
ncbi:MAG TPA: metalloregulator ArsR/SmtB family transcription factor, partial [Acidimicrobiales bacterium]|nr:metalloregulator ArsR/SmtB family transcription factor [Acidimicrobiales bacterium]